jgi:hypothetical protein
MLMPEEARLWQDHKPLGHGDLELGHFLDGLSGGSKFPPFRIAVRALESEGHQAGTLLGFA